MNKHVIHYYAFLTQCVFTQDNWHHHMFFFLNLASVEADLMHLCKLFSYKRTDVFFFFFFSSRRKYRCALGHVHGLWWLVFKYKRSDMKHEENERPCDRTGCSCISVIWIRAHMHFMQSCVVFIWHKCIFVTLCLSFRLVSSTISLGGTRFYFIMYFITCI